MSSQNMILQEVYNSKYTPLVGILTFGIVIYFQIRRDPRVQKIIEKSVQGPKAYPIIGNALDFIVPNHKLIGILKQLGEDYGSGFRIWLGHLAYVVITRGEEAEKVLSSNVLIEKAPDYSVLHPWLSTGLLTSKGKKWFTRRKMLTPTFHFKILDDFLEIMNEQSNTLVKILENESLKGAKTFDVFPFVTRCALDIISETAMGKKIYAQEKIDSEYVKSVYGIGEILVQRILRPWLRPDIIWRFSSGGVKEKKYLKIMHNFTESVIKERKIERSQNKNANMDEFDEDGNIKKKKLAFMDMLLDISQDGKVLSDLDIREEVDTFMFEGHDTTASNLAFTLCLFANYPEYQKKVQEELDEIYGEDRDRDLTQADISKMKFLECCIKESLRLYPSVAFFARHVTQDVEIGPGKLIPKNAAIFIATYLIHRDPRVFPDPEEFKPERFYPENIKGRNPYAYVPFSAGPRNCIGQKFAQLEEKVILSKVLVNFKLEAFEKRENIRLVPDIILRPLDGIHLKLTKRP